MADEAFALSPISARAVQPSEEDYAAISEAFMETSRGRWFLGEYAKRNRNTDTRMVLDAVARIEESLAAQRQAAAAEDAGRARAEAVAGAVTEVLAAIRDTVEAAQASATTALDALAMEQRLAPVRKGARVIREIAWRLREIGNDSRICDLIDSQVSTIETGASQISTDDVRTALDSAFASIQDQLEEWGSTDRTSPRAIGETGKPPSQVPVDAPAALADATQEAPARQAYVVRNNPPDAEAELAEADAALDLAETDEAEAGLAETAEIAAEANDEAILDMVAMEMGAPDPLDDDIDALLIEEARIAAHAPAQTEIVAKAPANPPAQPAPRPVARAPVSETPPAVSLGSTIIASGIVKKPGSAANDPLAPIRRLSQAEKVALFS